MAKIEHVYNPSVLEDCLEYLDFMDTFENVVHKDSPGRDFGFESRIMAMDCVDMDKLEGAQPGSNERTMDLVLSVADFDDERQVFTGRSLLPVELKLNCVAFNLGVAELQGKDIHTRSYNIGVGFNSRSVFLFTDQVVSHALNAVSRWRRGTNGNKMKEWKVMTPATFNSFVNFASDFPYRPKTDMGMVEAKILSYLSSRDVDGCASYIQDVLRKEMEAYYVKYNMHEINYVVEKLKEILHTVCVQNENLKEFEKEYLRLAAETIYGLAN